MVSQAEEPAPASEPKPKLEGGQGILVETVRSLERIVTAVFTHLFLGFRRFNTLRVVISGEIYEIAPPPTLWGRRTPRHTLREIEEALEFAARDPKIRSLVLVVKPLNIGWARLEALRAAVVRFRGSGKKAAAFLESGGNPEFYLASACDEIWMAPGGYLQLTGLKSEVLFLKRLLDKADIEAELVQAGEYKSAVEHFTRDSMSESHREALTGLLDSIFGQFVEGIARGRKRRSKKIRELIDQGPFLAKGALKHGLVDCLLYADEIEENVGRLQQREYLPIDLASYHRLRTRPLRWRDPLRPPFPVALIYAGGLIRSGSSGGGAPSGGMIGSDTLCAQLRRVRKSDRFKGAILRIDSPGGSAVASDAIWREVALYKGVKPLVVTMGDFAASGGYYIAMPAESIVAESSTITGSIGVISGKFNFRGLYEKLGLTKESIEHGARAGMDSDYRPYSSEELEKVRADLETLYGEFVKKVADGRRKKPSAIDAVARGRVWTGREAKRLGLVDVLGGLPRATSIIRERLGIPEAAPIDLVVFPKRRGLLSLIGADFREPVSGRLAEEVFGLLGTLDAWAALARERLLLILPYRLRIR